MKTISLTNTVRSTAVVVSLCLAMLAGCKQPQTAVKNPDGSITNPDGSVTIPAQQAAGGQLNSDGSITNRDGSVTYPANSAVAQRERQQPSATVAAAPAPTPTLAATAPQPAVLPPAEPAPAVVSSPVAITAPAGSSIRVRITETLAASRNDVGDRFSGVLDQPLMSKGQVVYPRGTPVAGEVVASKRKGHFAGSGDLGITITAIGRNHVSTSEYEAIAKGRGKRTGAIIGGGAGLGALIGGLAGGGKGALIGGLAGGGAGTAASAYSGSLDVIIRTETVITFRLRSAVTRR